MKPRKEGREMLQQANTIRLVVRDLSKSSRFYREVLGLAAASKPSNDSPWCATLRDGRRLVLVPSDAQRRTSSQASMTIELPNADAVVASHILARIMGGGASPPVLVNGRWNATLIDPDGHTIRVIEVSPARAPGRSAAGRGVRSGAIRLGAPGRRTVVHR